MSIIQGNAHTSAGGGGYQIERSLRFNSADSAYLNKTFSTTPTNRAKKTVSFWYKRSNLSSTQNLFSSYNGGGQDGLYITSGDSLSIYAMNGGASGTVNGVLRDVSAWYHIVYVIDTTQATAGDRLKIWINGVNFPSGSWTSYSAPSLNSTADILFFQSTEIGRDDFSSSGYLNGYLTETYFIDGQALTPSDFGETDSNTGVWKPKAFSGTYGTNGFFLKFADNSGTTSTTLGKDSSGNGNNWTPNNFSVTAGAGNDSLVDSPTSYGTDTGVGGEVRGNYCTLNPLANGDFGIATLTNGNLDASGSTNYFPASSTFALNSGMWYWEVLCTTREAGGNYPNIGLWVVDGWNIGSTPYTPSVTGGVSTWPNGIVGTPSGNTTYITWTVNDIVNFAYDANTGKVYIGKNGTWFNSGNPAAGTGFVYQYTAGTTLIPGGSFYSAAATYNFGQRAFAYTAPSGFKALCTQNLPTPTIGATSTTQANDYFNIALWNGDGATSRAITGLSHAPNFVWIKKRTSGGTVNRDHVLYDIIRGTGANLRSNQTNAESTGNTDELKSFDSDGFTLGSGDNVNGATGTPPYVGWAWRANGAGSSNTAGTITSTVSASTTSGFSIVTYTGNGTNGATFGHGLGVVPAMIIIKARNAVQGWLTYHRNMNATPQNGKLWLHLTNAYAADSSVWNNTAPTSTLITLGTGSECNGNTNTYVAYAFAPVAGYSAAFSYTGNASSDGPYIHLGFTPKFILIKSSSATGDWVLEDRSRSPYNVSTNYLVANSSAAETTGQLIDFLSNGFKIRVAVSSAMNGSGTSYIGFAWAENPFKYSLGI